jgi:hypothetical protein
MDEDNSQIAISKMKITKTSLFFIYTQIGCGGGEDWELLGLFFWVQV